MHIALDELRILHHLARGGMAGEEVPELVADGGIAFFPVGEALIDHRADAHFAALKLNPPGPPAFADEVVRGRSADSVETLAPIGIAGVESVPVARVAPARPHGQRGMVGVRPHPAIRPGEFGFEAGGIDHPTRTQFFFLSIGGKNHLLQPAGVERNGFDLRGTHQLRALRNGPAEHLLVENRAINQVGRNRGEILPAKLGAIGELSLAITIKPKAQAVF